MARNFSKMLVSGLLSIAVIFGLSGCGGSESDPPSELAAFVQAHRDEIDAVLETMRPGDTEEAVISGRPLVIGRGDEAVFYSDGQETINPLEGIWDEGNGRDEWMHREYTRQETDLYTGTEELDRGGMFLAYLEHPPEGYEEKEAKISFGIEYTLIYENQEGDALLLSAAPGILDGGPEGSEVYFRRLGAYTVMSDSRDYSERAGALFDRQTKVSVDIDREELLFPIITLASTALSANELFRLLEEVVVKHPHTGYEDLYSGRESGRGRSEEEYRLFRDLPATEWQSGMILGDGYPVLMSDEVVRSAERIMKSRGSVSKIRLLSFFMENGAVTELYTQRMGETERELVGRYSATDYAMAYCFKQMSAGDTGVERYGTAYTAEGCPVYYLVGRRPSGAERVLQIETVREAEGEYYYQRLVVPERNVPEGYEEFIGSLRYME